MPERNVGGATPFLKPGAVIPVRIPADLRKKAEQYAVKHGFPSFAYTVRYALKLYLDKHEAADKSG